MLHLGYSFGHLPKTYKLPCMNRLWSWAKAHGGSFAIYENAGHSKTTNWFDIMEQALGNPEDLILGSVKQCCLPMYDIQSNLKPM